jgi:hypothetical protein
MMRSHRDIRVTARGNGRVIAGRIGQRPLAMAMAQSIIRRYETRQTLPSVVDLIFKRFLPPTVMQPVYASTEINLSHHLMLRLALGLRLPPYAPDAERKEADQGRMILAEPLPEYYKINTLIERIIARENRIDSLRSRRAGEFPPGPNAQALPVSSTSRARAQAADDGLPVELVHRRTSPVKIDEPVTHPRKDDPAPARDEDYKNTLSSRVAGVQKVGALSPLDIKNLTDQVVQTIDKRIIAYRERTGRV